MHQCAGVAVAKFMAAAPGLFADVPPMHSLQLPFRVVCRPQVRRGMPVLVTSPPSAVNATRVLVWPAPVVDVPVGAPASDVSVAAQAPACVAPVVVAPALLAIVDDLEDDSEVL